MNAGHLALQVLADEQGGKWPARIAVSQSRYLLEHMGESSQSCSLQAHSLLLCRGCFSFCCAAWLQHALLL